MSPHGAATEAVYSIVSGADSQLYVVVPVWESRVKVMLSLPM